MSAAKQPKSSPEQHITNFHVLPKNATASPQAKQPVADNNEAAQSDVAQRDADAGVTGMNSQVNQPTRETSTDRSQVS